METILNDALTRNEYVFVPENVWNKKKIMHKTAPIKLRIQDRDHEDEILILQGATYLALRHF